MGGAGDDERAGERTPERVPERKKSRPAETPPEQPGDDTVDEPAEPGRGELPAWVESGARSLRGSGRGTGAGMEFGAAIVVFTLVGLWIDRRYDTLPLFLLIGLTLGFVGGFIHLVRTHGGPSKARRPPR